MVFVSWLGEFLYDNVSRHFQTLSKCTFLEIDR